MHQIRSDAAAVVPPVMFSDSVRIETTGVSENLMVGSTNKDSGRLSWPG
jgi:hypothetical protein